MANEEASPSVGKETSPVRAIEEAAAPATNGHRTMAKSLMFWKTVFEGNVARVTNLLDAANIVSREESAKDLRAAMLNLIHHLRFGRAICEDVVAGAPQPARLPLAFEFRPPWVREVTKQEIPWWTKPNRWAIFGTQVRDILQCDPRETNKNVVLKVGEILNVAPTPAALKKLVGRGSAAAVAAAIAHMVVIFDRTLVYEGGLGEPDPLEEHAKHNPSHLLALLETALKRAAEAQTRDGATDRARKKEAHGTLKRKKKAQPARRGFPPEM